MEWLTSIDAAPTPTAQEQALERLHELALTGAERLHWLTRVDAVLDSATRALASQYAEARRLPAEREAQLWNAGHGFHDHWARAYLQSLREISQARLDAEAAPALVARILYHCGRTAVWRNFRYIADPKGWWLDVHKLYAFAEREGFARQPLPLHDGEPARSSAMLYLQVLLLDSINRTSLTPSQVEAIYSWLHPWSAQLEIERDYREDRQQFFVNLLEDHGARRVRDFEPTDSCRYWRTEPMVDDIEKTLDAAEAGRGGSDDIEADILRLLQADWSPGATRQRRRHERDAVAKRASVANGIYAVCQEVGSQAMGNVHVDLDGELWSIENQSRYGFGAVVSTELNTWLKVGRLIALREETNLGMSVVGVVRSLKHLEEGKVYAGVEVLSHMALYGTLYELGEAQGSQPFPGIFIASDEERGTPSSLILPAIEYQPDAQLRLRLDRRSHHVWLSRLIEQKDDWVRVEVEVLGNA